VRLVTQLGSKPAVIIALGSGLLYLSHPTLVVRRSTSRSCHNPTFRGLSPADREVGHRPPDHDMPV
jgi:hypothetical protein